MTISPSCQKLGIIISNFLSLPWKLDNPYSFTRKHGVKCSMCDDKFSSIQDLKKHFTRVHDGIEPTESDIEAENEAENMEAENSQDEMAEIEAENNEAELSLNEEDTDITEDQILHQGN